MTLGSCLLALRVPRDGKSQRPTLDSPSLGSHRLADLFDRSRASGRARARCPSALRHGVARRQLGDSALTVLPPRNLRYDARRLRHDIGPARARPQSVHVAGFPDRLLPVHRGGEPRRLSGAPGRRRVAGRGNLRDLAVPGTRGLPDLADAAAAAVPIRRDRLLRRGYATRSRRASVSSGVRGQPATDLGLRREHAAIPRGQRCRGARLRLLAGRVPRHDAERHPSRGGAAEVARDAFASAVPPDPRGTVSPSQEGRNGDRRRHRVPAGTLRRKKRPAGDHHRHHGGQACRGDAHRRALRHQIREADGRV